MNSKTAFFGISLLLAQAVLAGTAAAPPSSSEPNSTAQVGEEHGHDESEGGHEQSPEGHAEAEAGKVQLTEGQIELIKVESAPATTGEISSELRLTGEVTLNQDRVADIVPRVSGVIREIRAYLGDEVRAEEVLAIIRSRELAEAGAKFMAARERLALAETSFAREKTLWEKKISSEREYLEAKQAFAEARIEQRSSEQELRALGLSSDELRALLDDPEELLTRYPISAPFGGTVIEKHAALGEQVDADTELFKIAQLDQVWVIGSVYEEDVARVAVGQPATVTVQAYPDQTFSGTVTWVASVIDEKTRTLKIRVEVDNRERLLKPGMFAQVAIGVDSKADALVIPSSAVQRQGGEAIVFVDEGNGLYERRDITIGRQSNDAIEVVAGLQEGERIVTNGGFLLKSELEKAGFEAGHGH